MESETDDLQGEMSFIYGQGIPATDQPKSCAFLNEGLNEDKELQDCEE